MNQRGSVVFIILISILIPFTFLSLGYLFGSKTTVEKKSQKSVSLQTSVPVAADQCQYNILSKAIFLPYYLVKKGDTLLQISTNYFGGSGRINEIVTLNEQTYNNLHFSYDIKEGWLLDLPPKFAFPSSGNFAGYSGKIVNETDTYWDFSTVNIKSSPLDYKLYKDPQTKYFGQESFHTNDCVRVIVDLADQKVIAISNQDPLLNYFKP